MLCQSEFRCTDVVCIDMLAIEMLTFVPINYREVKMLLDTGDICQTGVNLSGTSVDFEHHLRRTHSHVVLYQIPRNQVNVLREVKQKNQWL